MLDAFAACEPFQELAGTLYREACWLVSDHLGTPRMVVDRTGSLAAIRRHDYLPFGEGITAGVGGRTTGQGYGQFDGVRQKFAASERDGETGLDFMQARYYSSTQGRFTSVDPENAGADPEDPQTWNGYAYALNNPTVYVDPDGLKVRLYDKNGNFLGEIEDSEANKGLFNREWQRQNGHEVRRSLSGGRGEIYQNGELIGYYENTCCDWLAGSWQERVVQDLQKPETYRDALPGAILGTRRKGSTRSSTATRPAPRQIGRYGYEGSPSFQQAVQQVSRPGTHRQVGGRVPTRAEAEQLIHQSGGRIDRIERAHRGRGHNFDHINYTTADGQKATVRVQSVGRQFYRDSRPKNE